MTYKDGRLMIPVGIPPEEMCPKCGSGGTIIKTERRDFHVPGFHLDFKYYECGKCKEMWANGKLLKDE
jgi:ribosomal protein S27AE